MGYPLEIMEFCVESAFVRLSRVAVARESAPPIPSRAIVIGLGFLGLQGPQENTPDCLRPRRLRVRLLRNPGIQRGFQLGVEAQANVRADASLRPAPSSFSETGYCAAPKITVPENTSNRSKAAALPRL